MTTIEETRERERDSLLCWSDVEESNVGIYSTFCFYNTVHNQLECGSFTYTKSVATEDNSKLVSNSSLILKFLQPLNMLVFRFFQNILLHIGIGKRVSLGGQSIHSSLHNSIKHHSPCNSIGIVSPEVMHCDHPGLRM